MDVEEGARRPRVLARGGGEGVGVTRTAKQPIVSARSAAFETGARTPAWRVGRVRRPRSGEVPSVPQPSYGTCNARARPQAAIQTLRARKLLRIHDCYACLIPFLLGAANNRAMRDFTACAAALRSRAISCERARRAANSSAYNSALVGYFTRSFFMHVTIWARACKNKR
jgi:hypothetical protein